MIRNYSMNQIVLEAYQGPPPRTSFQMDGQDHDFVFDGQVEQAILDKTKGPASNSFVSLQEMTDLCRSGSFEKARDALEAKAHPAGKDHPRCLAKEVGAKIRWDVGKSREWTVSSPDLGETLEIRNADPGSPSEQTIHYRPRKYGITLSTDTAQSGDERVQQHISGFWNPLSKTVVVTREVMERVTDQQID